MKCIATKTLITKESFVNGYELSENGKVTLHLCNNDTGRERDLETEPFDEDELKFSISKNEYSELEYRYLVKTKDGNIILSTAKNIRNDLLPEDKRDNIAAPRILFYGTKEDKEGKDSKKTVTFVKGDIKGLLEMLNYTLDAISRVPEGAHLKLYDPYQNVRTFQTATEIIGRVRGELEDYHILDGDENRIL